MSPAATSRATTRRLRSPPRTVWSGPRCGSPAAPRVVASSVAARARPSGVRVPATSQAVTEGPGSVSSRPTGPTHDDQSPSGSRVPPDASFQLGGQRSRPTGRGRATTIAWVTPRAVLTESSRPVGGAVTRQPEQGVRRGGPPNRRTMPTTSERLRDPMRAPGGGVNAVSARGLRGSEVEEGGGQGRGTVGLSEHLHEHGDPGARSAHTSIRANARQWFGRTPPQAVGSRPATRRAGSGEISSGRVPLSMRAASAGGRASASWGSRTSPPGAATW